ncbi:MAG TPA: DinB family protein [Silvibacterium sp.]|nr:DinB family protein [Silvibacterium sp.]
MTRDDIQQIYEYDRWANNRVLEAASTLNAEQFTRDLGGSFCSVRDTLVHILAAEWIWLAVWHQPSPTPEFMAELRKRRETLFVPAAFPDLVAVKSKWSEIEREQADFVGALTEAELARMIPARGGELSLAHLMQHLANHSTYHRGQISLMMRQLQAQPGPTDFHLFLTERRDAHS